MNNCTTIKACRLCKNEEIETILYFGLSPLANSYPKSKSEEEDAYPLTVVKCKSCGHVQLKQTINPQILFSNYSYASSDSPSLITHFHEFARIVNRFGLTEYSSILEIGCNDGILLKEFLALGFVNVYGVEPAENLAERARKTGCIIYNDFFDYATAQHINRRVGPMDVICANNVFAHVAELDEMVAGVLDLLTDDGVFIFENAYLLDTIKGLYFDQIYHEHLQYYGIRPLERYLESFGLQIFDIQHVATQGGSFRIFAKRGSCEKWKVKPSVQEWIKKEDDYGLYNNETYSLMMSKIKDLQIRIGNYIDDAISEGKTVCCYGCPAKFALFSKVFNLSDKNITYVVDDSPLKQGRFSPGRKIPIVSRQHFLENPTDICLISVWNMSDAVISRNPQYKGRWIIPMPEFKII